MSRPTADVVICGAGIAGIAAAYYLTVKHGIKNVSLVDERPPLSLTSDKSTECYRNWWPGPGDAMVSFMNRSIDLLETLAYESGNLFNLNRRGYVYATADPARILGFQRACEEISALGAGPLRLHSPRPALHTPHPTPYSPPSPEGFETPLTGADLVLDRDLIREHFPYLAKETVAVIHARRAGWFSAQTLGMYLLERARENGARLIPARVESVKVINARVEAVHLNDGSTIAAPCFVDAAGPYVVAVKPQTAFFEALGAEGFRALEDVCAYARDAGLLVIADGKRGDIGSTARAYSAAFLEPRGGDPPLADALTVNAYLGGDSVEPFLGACRRHGAGIFCLVRTSNAGAADVQDVSLSDGRTLWQHVAGLVREWGTDLVGERGLSSVGAVVGATYPRAVAEARRLMPQAVLLLPGVGAQGASAADVARAFTSGPASALVAASRSIIYAHRGSDADWRAAAGAEAARLASEVWAASGW